MAKNARPRNPRVSAMEVIKMMSSNVAAMKARWSFVPSTRFHMTEDGEFIHVTRERKDIPALEYRENDPEEWARLAQFMDVVAGQAEAVARFARVQAKEARKRLDPPAPLEGTRLRPLPSDDPHSSTFQG